MAVDVGGLCGMVLFYLVILAIGLLAAYFKTRKIKQKENISSEETIIAAGRDIGVIVGAFTMTATWVGGGYINGTAEAIYRQDMGFIWCQAPIGYALSVIIGGIFFAKPMREKEYLTMLDPLQERHGTRIGALLYLPALCGELLWSAAILAALGATLSVIVGLSIDVSIIVSAAFAILYTLVGGQFSVAYTDVAQLICIAFGLSLCIPFAWNNQYVHWNQTDSGSDESQVNFTTTPSSISTDSTDWVGALPIHKLGIWLDNYLFLIFGGLPWQVYFQRVLSSKTVRVAQWLSIWGGVGCLILAIPPALIGVIAKKADWNAAGYNASHIAADTSLVLPAVIEYLTPRVVAFFGLGAVAAAVMSSVDASVLSAASMFARNIYKCVFRQNASQSEIIWVLRGAVVVCGALATVLAITVTSIYDLWYLSSDLVYVILFPQLVFVLFVPFVNRYGVVIGYLVGLVLRLLAGESLLMIPVILKYPYYNDVDGQLFPVRTIAMICNCIATITTSLFVHWLFEKQELSKKFDIFGAFRKETKAQKYELSHQGKDNWSTKRTLPVGNEGWL